MIHTRSGEALAAAVLCCLALAGLALHGCGRPAGEQSLLGPAEALFADVTDDVGLVAELDTWPEGTYFLPEIMGGGVALFDADDDADLDLLQVRFPPPGQPEAPAPNRLFRQDDDGRFRESTTAGLDDPGYGQGVAVGDADGDGHPDVYFANYGADGYYRSQGNGRFARVPATARLAQSAWSTSAAFVDYDRDGDLDLFVVHYVEYYSGVTCRSPQGIDYCPPKKFKPVGDALYRNLGDGTFAEATLAAGIDKASRGLGVVCADLTRDGWVDIYVANDGEANQLWVGQGDGTFADEAVMRGVGFNGSGKPEGSMGVAVGHVNADDLPDLVMTNLWNESNTLFIASGQGVFTDESGDWGMAAVDLPYTGFGCGLFDFDHDGDLDFAVVNGRVQEWPPLAGARPERFWSYYAEPNLLFESMAGGRFRHVGTRGGAFTSLVEVDRGLAFGDIDRDGDLDLAVGGLDRVRLLRNDAPPPGRHWLIIRTLSGQRDAIGAEVTVEAGDRRYRRLVVSAYSYGSSSPARAHFGLGNDVGDAVEVLWPDGHRERFELAVVDQELTLRQGEGEAR